MNLTVLVKKATAVIDAEDGTDRPGWRPPFDMDAERERWADTLDPLEGVLGAELVVPVFAYVVREWDRFLEGVAYYTHPDCPTEPAGRFVARRYPGLIRRFVELVPADLRPVVFTDEALNGNASTQNPWLGRWLHELSIGQSRLPVDLTADTMTRLLAVYTDPGYRDIRHMIQACRGCGLRRPWRGLNYAEMCVKASPEYFPACPHCGESQVVWGDNRPECPWTDRIDAECGV